MTSYDLVFSLGKKVLEGGQLSFEEALSLTTIDASDIPILLGIANKIREKFTGSMVDTCQIAQKTVNSVHNLLIMILTLRRIRS